MAITKVWLDEQDNQGNECASCAEFKALDGESHKRVGFVYKEPVITEYTASGKPSITIHYSLQ